MNRPSANRRRVNNVPGGKNQVRIIGGKWRGRKLSFPGTPGLRPTGDRIRETLFNWLMPVLPNARCLDLFSGSAALGMEALSRGAANVVFVEKDRAAAQAIAENCARLKADNWQLHHGDALLWLAKPATTPFDIVFLDPPFADNLLSPTLTLLADNNYLGKDARIYLETNPGNCVPTPPSLRQLKEKSTGQVHVYLYQCI